MSLNMPEKDLDNYPQKVLETYDLIEKLFGNGARLYHENEVIAEALLRSLDDLYEYGRSDYFKSAVNDG